MTPACCLSHLLLVMLVLVLVVLVLLVVVVVVAVMVLLYCPHEQFEKDATFENNKSNGVRKKRRAKAPDRAAASLPCSNLDLAGKPVIA